MDEEEFQLDDAISQLQREICKGSFAEFLKEFWSVLISNELIWNWHMDVLCDELQEIGERVIAGEEREYNLVINVPPGTSKSTIGSVMFPAWLWTLEQGLRFCNATYAQTLSNDLSLKCRTIIESDKYKRLFPEMQLKPDANQKSLYYNTGKGYRFATSVQGTITGLHFHIICVDDPLSPKEAGSPVKTEAANDWFNSTLSTRWVDKNIGTMILIMQRLSEDDCTAHLLENGRSNIKHICLPAELTDDVRPINLREKYVDGLLDPLRMTKKFLKAFEETNGSYVYAGQMLQTPTPPSGGMFDTNELEVIDMVDPKDIIDTWRSWDKAGTDANKKKNPDACYTAGAKLHKLRDGTIVVADMVRGRWNADVREKVILKTAHKDKRKTNIIIEQEPGSGGKESAQNTIRMLSGFKVIKERPQGDKIFRADPFSVQVNNGNVKMLRGAWNKEFINEMKHFPLSRFKDQIDAASMAFARLNRASKPSVRSL